ncbi:hypothetical protein [Pseudarthrobacter sp. Y6]|uniref:hypothetical protein n=1 Tax=Pseudarthrobacter sp. Y6 TaxID=3418422 RepID=UPI003CE6E2FA
MKVVTKLAKMEFTIGTLVRKDDFLIMESGDDTETMKFRAQITPEDVVATIKAGLNLQVLFYVLQLPILLRRRQRLEHQKSRAPSRQASPK